MKQDISEIKTQIVEALMPLNPEKIILFGSYAYGTPTEDSDLDICVVETEYESRWEEKSKIRELLKDIRVPMDILVPYHDEYEFYKRECGSVYKDVEDRGEVLWSL
jgi:predicted nucleotidyltransferase